jgi:Tfp pilus assembly protein PilZ
MALSVHQGELRRHARVELQRRAWCEHRDYTLYLSIANISREGLFIQTSTPFHRGERLRVCLADRTPRSTVPVELEAEVVWSSPRGRLVGVGCRIVAFAQGGERYAELVEQLAKLGR